MFRPNTFCHVWERAGYDEWGDVSYGTKKRIKCAVVRLSQSREKTSVRADSSASRGKAYENQADAVLLFPPTHLPAAGSRVEIMGMNLEVAGYEPRMNIMGRLDHYEVSLSAWVSA